MAGNVQLPRAFLLYIRLLEKKKKEKQTVLLHPHWSQQHSLNPKNTDASYMLPSRFLQHLAANAEDSIMNHKAGMQNPVQNPDG
mmetsp:Transcript_2035/g.3136  ORF Transcript_2035/g.3136 Transcript_2035/m.3136 type:complete len:84 (-) Transcript_2035:43-294(-)